MGVGAEGRRGGQGELLGGRKEGEKRCLAAAKCSRADKSGFRRAFLHAEDCGKVLGFLGLGRLGLEFVEPGIAHSRGCQEVGVGVGKEAKLGGRQLMEGGPSHPAFLEQLGVARGS